MVLYLLLAAFLGGLGYFLFQYVTNGSQWAMQPYNGHVYSENSTVKLGDITDRDGNLLASTEEGQRIYSGDETVRRALLHTVGDPYGYISTSIQYTMRSKLSGYNIVTGLNDTIFNRMGSDITLTVNQSACTAAYNALGGRNGAAILYNYETGEVLVKVSAPTFDPASIPEDLETNDAYKGAYLDNTLSATFTPGSIFKIVTAAAAMERWPDSWSSITYDCQGAAEFAGSDITCLNGHAHGTQDMAAALGNSCNVYFAHLANELGADALEKKAKEMGFDVQFHLGSVSTAESTIDLTDVNANQLGWAGVGQYTVLANPYHMMLLMGAIAEGGTYTQPVLTQDSSLLDSLGGGSRHLVSSTVAQNLKTLLRGNVENYYGDWLFPTGMNVCAKTGTGEVGEDKGPNCWMVGFCDSTVYPYAFAVVVEDGSGGIETAGSVVSAMLSALA
jgi:peptidoglycan glycosyltransferase